MPKWTDYTIKTNPADKDEVMILDTAGKANKRLGLSVLSDWILNKIVDKVFQKLETNSKTVLGAINELNSNSFSYRYISSLTNEKNTQFRFSVANDIAIGSKTIPAYTKGIITAYTDAMMIGVFGVGNNVELYIGYRSGDVWTINCIK